MRRGSSNSWRNFIPPASLAGACCAGRLEGGGTDTGAGICAADMLVGIAGLNLLTKTQSHYIGIESIALYRPHAPSSTLAIWAAGQGGAAVGWKRPGQRTLCHA